MRINVPLPTFPLPNQILEESNSAALDTIPYHSRFTPEEVAEVSQIFLRDTHVLPKLVSYEEHCRRDRW
jgi:hypothetical protein